jgi:hypothetical protein
MMNDEIQMTKEGRMTKIKMAKVGESPTHEAAAWWRPCPRASCSFVIWLSSFLRHLKFVIRAFQAADASEWWYYTTPMRGLWKAMSVILCNNRAIRKFFSERVLCDLGGDAYTEVLCPAPATSQRMPS